MNETVSSPPPKGRPKGVAQGHKTKRSGLGCAILFVVLLVGLGVATVFLAPRLVDQVVAQMSAPTLALSDSTSPEQLAARRAAEIAQLNGFGWVDEADGVAHIPIDQAIALLAEAGLPVDSEGVSNIEEIADSPATDLANVNYEDHVLPIFKRRCADCHGDDEPEEGLKLTTYRATLNGSQNGAVIEPGDPDGSYLVELIVTGQMPKRREPLPQAEIDTIIAWIEAGAPEKGAEGVATVDLANVSFQANVLPIFEQHCWECHGDEKQEEGLKLTSYRTVINGSQNGTVVEPGDPAGSYLVELIANGQMPKRGDPLSQAEIDIISAWVEAGALEN